LQYGRAPEFALFLLLQGLLLVNVIERHLSSDFGTAAVLGLELVKKMKLSSDALNPNWQVSPWQYTLGDSFFTR